MCVVTQYIKHINKVKIIKKISYNYIKNFIESNSDCQFLSNEYTNNKTKLMFKCKCGKIFETTFYKFKEFNKRQCNECGRKIRDAKDRLSYAVIKEYIEQESNSNCKLLTPESSYKNMNTKINILCDCGDIFITTFAKFKFNNKRQCNKCSYNNIKKVLTFTYDYVKAYIETHSDCKLLSEKYVGCYEPLELECHCKRIFSLSFTAFKQNKGKQCSHCNQLFSEGENRIEQFLIELNIKYKHQYSFNDLPSSSGKYKLRFDFAILNDNGIVECLIEFDGKQHYMPIEYFGGVKAFNKLKDNDKMKQKYCIKNKYMLIRIPYYDMDNICEILTNNLQLIMTIPSQAC